MQRVDAVHVLEEQAPAVLEVALHPVQVDVLLRVVPVVGAQADHVALVGHHVVQLVLAEEALEGGVAFALFLARLDGHRQVITATKVEAEEDVGDGGAHPVNGDQVHPLQLAQVEALVVPGGGVVGFAAVLEVADVVHRDQVAFDAGMRQFGDVRQPVALVGRLDAVPPDAQHHEHGEVAAQGAPAPAAQGQGHQRGQRGEAEGRSQAVAQCLVGWPRKQDGQHAPAPDSNNQQAEQHQADDGDAADPSFSHERPPP
ncbi:hypothetical protein D3C75_805760 [compost metagenome]